jgi:glycosyltransferase involved in cell wall biosynthesis
MTTHFWRGASPLNSFGDPGKVELRILLVSQFWPSAADPDLGAFLPPIVERLQARGHVVDRAVVDRRGAGRAGDVRMLRDAVRLALGRKPDVVFAHFLLPAGFAAALASLPRRTPLVLMAHGQDVRNAVASAAVRAATAFAIRRAHTTIFNSAYLRDQLPLTPKRSAVIDLGVDLDRFHGADPAAARAALDLPSDGPLFLFAGSLIERKNVVRLADAVERLGRGTLVVLGDGPLRPQLEGRSNLLLRGQVPHADVAAYMAAADVVCLPSLEEPLGQVLLEAMASERSVVATTVGGPPEFVTPAAGALVDPLVVDAIRAGLEHAAALPTPNAAARAAAAEHSLDRQAERMERVLRDAAARR